MQKTTRNKSNSRKAVSRNRYSNKKMDIDSNNIAKMRISNKVDMPLIIVVLMLVALGIVMVLSASAPSALADPTINDSYYYMRKQAIAAVIGFAAMYLISKIDYKIFKKFYKIIYYLSILILFTVLIPGLKVDANRSCKMD